MVGLVEHALPMGFYCTLGKAAQIVVQEPSEERRRPYDYTER